MKELRYVETASGLLVPEAVPEPAPRDPNAPPRYMHLWNGRYYHTFNMDDPKPRRSLCGKWEVSVGNTKTIGAAHCVACMDAEGVPTKDGRRHFFSTASDDSGQVYPGWTEI